MKKDIWPLQWLLLFLRFPLMISVFQGVWGRTEETFSCVYVVFLRPCFLSSRFNFLTRFSSCCVCLHQAAIICHFRNPLFIHLLERNALLFWPTVFAPVWSVCVKQSSGRFTHTKHFFQLKAGMTDLRTGHGKLNRQKHFLNDTQMVWFHASREADVDLLQGQ